jgi:hypothetical protein
MYAFLIWPVSGETADAPTDFYCIAGMFAGLAKFVPGGDIRRRD